MSASMPPPFCGARAIAARAILALILALVAIPALAQTPTPKAQPKEETIEKTVDVELCVGKQTSETFQTTGFTVKGAEPSTATSANPAVAGASIKDSNSIVISGVSAGFTTITLTGEGLVGLQGLDQPATRKWKVTYHVRVRNCWFTSGDWPVAPTPPPGQKPPANPPPPPAGEPAGTPPDVHTFPDNDEFANLPCRADAERAIRASLRRYRFAYGSLPDGATTWSDTKGNEGFDRAVQAAGGSITPRALERLDFMKSTADRQVSGRHYLTYSDTPAPQEHVTVVAIEGFVSGDGFHVFVMLLGSGECTPPRVRANDANPQRHYHTYIATIDAKYNHSLDKPGAQKFTLLKNTVKAKFIELECCPPSETPRTATGVAPSPSPSPEPSPSPGPGTGGAPKTIERDPNFKEVRPKPGRAAPNEPGAMLPPTSPAGGQILASYVDPSETGVQSVVVQVIEQSGRRRFFQGATDAAGRFWFAIPAGVAAVELARDFDGKGLFHAGSRSEIEGPNFHLPGTQPVPNPPAGNAPAITEINAASNIGPSGGRIVAHTANLDPVNTRVLIRGQEGQADLIAASQTSAVIVTKPGIPLGDADVKLVSNGTPTNTATCTFVRITTTPLPPAQAGMEETLRFQVDGIPRGRSAHLHLTAIAPTELAGGQSSADVPVQNGAASVSLRGRRAGVGGLQYEFRLDPAP